MSAPLRFIPRPALRRPLGLVLATALLLTACRDDDPPAPSAATPPPTRPADPGPGTPTPTPVAGRWTTGDLHVHTTQSDDAQTPLDTVLDQGLTKSNLDWIALTDHLRVSHRDHTGATLPDSAGIPMSQGIRDDQLPRIRQLQAAGRYADKLIYSAAEWDIPTHDHGNVGIFSGAPLAPDAQALNHFEYLFTNRPASQFAPADVAAWDAADARAYTTHDDALAALRWLHAHHPDTSYLLFNHPSRSADKYKAADFRAFNDIAPDIAFAIEGLVGNQMEPDRGGYNSAYVPANLKARTYGGADYVVAQVGGVWDALLGEGRRIWTIADSDHHFKVSPDNRNSSGYYPGEYAKTHVWMTGNGLRALLDGLRSGRVFAVFGDLVDALDFQAADGANRAQMGGELTVAPGRTVRLTLRFKSPSRNNMEFTVGSSASANVQPVVDHVDLIAGDVAPRALPGTPGYDKATNDSTKVIATFTKADWQTDRDGYRTVSYDVVATKNRYYRLRGTNLGVNVPGETQDGNPLPDARVDNPDNAQRFNAINLRNYGDLWFYSNPVFVTVKG
jgi:hypothetical protein